MKIGFDIRYISHGLKGGVRTYVYYLAREMPRCAPDKQFFFYADTKAPLELTEFPANVTLRTMPWTGALSSVRNDARLGRLMERDGVDIAHAPANYGPKFKGPLVLTLHDSLNLFPMSQHLRGFSRKPRQVAMMLYLGRMTRETLTRAGHVITVSEHARQDIAARSSYPLSKMTTIYEAGAESFARVDARRQQEVRERWKLGPRLVLADGIKNPAAVVAGFQKLPDEIRHATNLVFFSREPAPRPAVAEVLGNAEVRFIPQPATEELVALMNLATVFAFPSWYEGFGLPLVEAMQCGTPIVASTRGSIPEIVGDAGLVSDLERPEEFAAHLRQMIEDAGVRAAYSERALRRAETFTWKRAAQETLRIYERVASEAGLPR